MTVLKNEPPHIVSVCSITSQSWNFRSKRVISAIQTVYLSRESTSSTTTGNTSTNYTHWLPLSLCSVKNAIITFIEAGKIS